MQDLLRKDNHGLKPFHGSRKEHSLICCNNKMVVPKMFQTRLTEWYHTMLCHPGKIRTEETAKQHSMWKGTRSTVHNICLKCETCQKYKRTHKRYSKLPEKEAEGNPWEKLCMDLIGPYKIAQSHKQEQEVPRCVTMIDPATGWFEMQRMNNKQPSTVAQQVEAAWLTRYPWPEEIIHDRGSELPGDFADMIKEDYPTIKQQPTTT